MKNIKIVYLFIFALISFSSCVKDNSNDKFNKLNEITIEGIEDKYEINLRANLEIQPVVTSDDNDLSYMWYVYSKVFGSKKDTLSTDKDISVMIAGDRIVPGTEYKLVLRVTDNITGVHTFSKEKLLFSKSIYSKGVLMLCETSGVKELNMLSSDEVLKNIYSINNGGVALSNEYREVVFSNPSPQQLGMKQVFLFADNKSGGVVLNTNTLIKEYDVRDMFDSEISADILSVRGYSGKIGNIDYVILNDKLCKRPVNTNTPYFEADPLVISGLSGDFKIQGFVMDLENPILYDEMNGKIVAHAPWNRGTLIRSTEENTTTGPFDLDNLGDYSLVSSGMAGRENWMLMNETTTNELTCFKLNYEFINYGNAIHCAPLAKFVVNPAAAPNLHTADFIIPITGLMNFCIYIKGQNVYALNIGSISESTTTSKEVLLTTLDANHTINKATFVTVSVPDPTEEDKNKTRRANQLRLLIQDNSLSELKGGFIFYEITTAGGITIKHVKEKIGGFCDKIVDVAEKDS